MYRIFSLPDVLLSVSPSPERQPQKPNNASNAKMAIDFFTAKNILSLISIVPPDECRNHFIAFLI